MTFAMIIFTNTILNTSKPGLEPHHQQQRVIFGKLSFQIVFQQVVIGELVTMVIVGMPIYANIMKEPINQRN
jgi:hypothetical protein